MELADIVEEFLDSLTYVPLASYDDFKRMLAEWGDHALLNGAFDFEESTVATMYLQFIGRNRELSDRQKNLVELSHESSPLHSRDHSTIDLFPIILQNPGHKSS